MSDDLITKWESSGALSQLDTKNTAIRLRSLYEYMAIHLYSEYEPTKRVSARNNRDFLLRLKKWLECMDSEEDQWIAFKSLEYFFFAGVNEYNELYRCAHEHCIIPWLVETNSLNIFDSTLEEKINSLIKNCWFCPVTDSLRINGFLHVTGIKGKSLRPDWLSLKDLGSVDKIEKYIRKHEISRLVLIEDFSGSGYQISRALKFAAENLKIPILLVPLIICDQGDKTLEQLITSKCYSHVAYRPVTVIDRSCLIGEEKSKDEPPLFTSLRSVMRNCYHKILEDVTEGEIEGEEFGYSKIGSLVALYSNCPNNTPPMYHHLSTNWSPIFPRSSRA